MPGVTRETADFKRLAASVGTAIVAADYAAHANWGTTPTIAPLAGSTDTRGSVTVTAQATTGANPTLTLTFKDGAYAAAPLVVACKGGTAAAAPTTTFWIASSTTTTAVFTLIGTPTAGNDYVLNYAVLG